jgi:transposase
MDLRKRIIDAKSRGDTEDKISSEKDVSKSAVTKLWSLYRKTGSYAPRANPCGRKAVLSLEELAQISQFITDHPDITLQELIDQLGLPLSVSGLSKIIRFKLGLRYKKNATPHRTKS